MTHDELLIRIAKLSITPESNVVPSELAAALLAVVQMHKPWENWYEGIDELTDCKECSDLINDSVKYPCDTVKTIIEIIQ